MQNFWNGFYKEAGIFDTTIEHVITGKGTSKIPLKVGLDDKNLEAAAKAGKALLALAGGFGVGSILGRGLFPQNPVTIPHERLRNE